MKKLRLELHIEVPDYIAQVLDGPEDEEEDWTDQDWDNWDIQAMNNVLSLSPIKLTKEMIQDWELL